MCEIEKISLLLQGKKGKSDGQTTTTAHKIKNLHKISRYLMQIYKKRLVSRSNVFLHIKF